MENEVKNLFEFGYNYKEIGKKLGKDPRTIKKIIINNEFKQLRQIRRSKYGLNENYFDKINDKQLWLIGLLAADGYIRGNSVGISQSGEEGKEMINFIKNEVSYDGLTYTAKTIAEPSYSFIITSHKFVDVLSKFNIVENKSLIYELPEFKTENELRNFIRGYIDGDGSIGVYDNGNGYEYLVISFVGTKKFIDSVGSKLPIPFSSKTEKKSKNCWELRWYGKKAIEFCNWCFANNGLYRSKKVKLYNNYLSEHSPNYLKYDIKKNEVMALIKKGLKVVKIVELTGIPFQTIYKWKKEF